MISAAEFNKVDKLLLDVWESKYSSFYRKRYKRLRIDLSKISKEDFENLPFLTREDIVDTHPFERLYIPQDQIVSFNLSSGTTSQGQPLLVPMQKWDEVTFKQLYKKLINLKIKRIMILSNTAYSSARATDWLLDDKLKKYPFIMGNIHNLEASAHIANLLRIDAIETNPSALFYFIPFLQGLYSLDKIRYISMGGEYVTAQRFIFFKQHFKKAFFDFRFGGAENQVLKGWRCKYLSSKEPRFFHPTSEYYYFEVIDPQSAEVLKEGEEGELVQTSKDISAFPLIRYRTGDIVRISPMKCPCGQRELLEVLGRARGDSFHLYGATLHVEEIERALAKVKDLDLLNYQMHVYEVIDQNKLKPSLVLEISAKNSSDFSSKGVAEIIEKNLHIASRLTLAQLVEKGVFLPLKVKFMQEPASVSKSLKIVPHLN